MMRRPELVNPREKKIDTAKRSHYHPVRPRGKRFHYGREGHKTENTFKLKYLDKKRDLLQGKNDNISQETPRIILANTLSSN